MNDQNHGDHRRIQPPPGWPGTAPDPAQPPPGAPPPGPPSPGWPGAAHPGHPAPGYPPQGYPGHPPQGQPAPGYGPPGRYGQPYPPPYAQPYGNQPYATGGYGAPPPPPPRKRRGLRTVLVVVFLAALGGGGYLAHRSGLLAPVLGPLLGGTAAAPVPPDGSDAPAAGGDGGLGAARPGLSTTVPGCPFNADQVTSMVGQPMVDKGTCLFGDGKGVAQLGIEVHSASSTAAALSYARQQAAKQYLLVEDLKNGDQGYIAYKNTAAEAMAVTTQGGYTITMSSFERFNGFTYEEPLTAIIGALPR